MIMMMEENALLVVVVVVVVLDVKPLDIDQWHQITKLCGTPTPDLLQRLRPSVGVSFSGSSQDLFKLNALSLHRLASHGWENVRMLILSSTAFSA